MIVVITEPSGPPLILHAQSQELDLERGQNKLRMHDIIVATYSSHRWCSSFQQSASGSRLRSRKLEYGDSRPRRNRDR